MKTLREVKIGETVKVVKLHGEGPVKRRTCGWLCLSPLDSRFAVS